MQKEAVGSVGPILNTLSLTQAARIAIGLLGIFLRQPAVTKTRRIIFAAVFFPCIIITWNYEFYLIAQLVVPKNFQPFQSLKEMMAKKFTIYYPQLGDSPEVRNNFLQRIIDEFAVQGIKHDGNQTFIELNSTLSEDGLENLSKSNAKMAVVYVTQGVDYKLAWIKEVVHGGKYSCYALLQALLYRFMFDYTMLNIFERVKSVNSMYGEAGFKQIWREWEEFYLNTLRAKLPENIAPNGNHLSFKNLLSFFIIYVVLLTCFALGMVYELGIYRGLSMFVLETMNSCSKRNVIAVQRK